jgi:hypothetical protein
MKKLFITILFLVCFTGLVFPKSSDVVITQDNRVIGKLTSSQFELLVQAADNYQEIMLAQKENRVSIQIISDIEKTSVPGQYKAVLKIQWLNSKNEEINFVSSVMFLTIDNPNDTSVTEWKILYRDIAEIGFPLSSVLLILIIIVLL